MLDLDRILENPEELKRMLASRNLDANEVDWLVMQDELRRKLTAESKAKKTLRNQMSKKIGTIKQQGGSDAEIRMITREMRALGPEIAALDVDIAELDDKINVFLLSTPNYPHESVPAGSGETCDPEVGRWDAPGKSAREAKPYWNIGTDLGIFDFDFASAVGDTQLTVYRGLGAQLERAVVNFLLDTHIDAGYREVASPYVILSDRDAELQSLPVFEDDAAGPRAYPVRLAQSAAVHLYRDMELTADKLPVHHCAFSACFRSVPVRSGLDPCGLVQQHQSNRIELMILCKPGHSYEELLSMTEQVQKVLRLLNLSYRVMLTSAADLDFSAAKTFEIEVWMPSRSRYVRVSDCSNCEDFQARRLNIRYREKEGGELRFCHSLNGSGLMVGRTVAAILENHQNGDGSVAVPEVLRPYMHTDTIR
jgi:seryl-tRNA synthetase